MVYLYLLDSFFVRGEDLLTILDLVIGFAGEMRGNVKFLHCSQTERGTQA